MVDQITGDTLLDATVPAVADKITQGWNLIVGEKKNAQGEMVPNIPLPNQAGREKIARDFLLTKKLTIDDISIDVGELSTENKKQLTNYGLDIEGLEAFANKDKRDKFASAVDEGVQSQDHWWIKVLNFIMGLFSWMASGFEGGFDGLWSKVGEQSSARMTEAVNESVGKAMEADPTLAKFKPYMGQVNEAIHDKVMEVATGKTAEARGVPPRPEAKPFATDPEEIKKAVTGNAKQTIDKSVDDNKGLDESAKFLLASSGWSKGNVDIRVQEMKTSLKTFALKAATDKDFKLSDKPTDKMTDQEFRSSVRAKLVEHFKTMEVTTDEVRKNDGRKESRKIKLTDWYQSEWLDTTLRKYLTEKYSSTSTRPPTDKEKLPEYLADQVLAKMKGDELENLKTVRILAEKDYSMNLSEKLIFNDRTARAQELALNKNYKSLDSTPDAGDPVAPRPVAVVPPKSERAHQV